MRKSILGFTIIYILFLSVPISLQDTIQDAVSKDNYTDRNISSGGISLQEIYSTSFVLKWNTALGGTSNGTQVQLPIYDGGTYDFEVDWGDGTSVTITAYDQGIHTYYNAPGVYTIVINGTLKGWRFQYGGDRLKIIEISQWGNINFGNLGGYFYGCENLVLTATDTPNLTGTTILHRTFSNCDDLGNSGSMNEWDVSSVTNMALMFNAATSFNQPIGNWNVSSVTTMIYMFSFASSFNQPIGNWDVSSVGDMAYMFRYAYSFDQNVGSWNVSSIRLNSLYHMFYEIKLSIQNYDNLLIGWSNYQLQYVGDFHAGYSQYSPRGRSARQHITSTYSWNIYDGGIVYPPEISNPDDMDYISQTTGNQIQWTVGDKNPDIYNVTLDGSLYVTDTWSNGSINVDIDDLSIGVHDFIIYVFDSDDNMYSDTVIVTVFENTVPDLSLAIDKSFKVGSSGNEIVWDVGDLNPDVYNITRDGTLIGSTESWVNGTITLDIDGLSVDTYEFIIFVYDIYGNMASDVVIIEVTEIDAPEVSNPNNISYKQASTGNLLEWIVRDSNPWVYNITRDGTLFGSTESWVNGTISIGIDGLSVGIYEFIIYIYDIHGNMASDTVTVTVTESTPPDISSPDNISYDLGTTGNQIEWTVGDINPTTYNITMDGILYTDGTWANGTISLDIDGLPLGLYIVILNVYDARGNRGSDTVMVVVSEPSTDTTTEPTSDTSTDPTSSVTTDTTDTPIFFTFVILGLVVFVFRRRQNTA